jgi:hypothetical protein
MAISASPRVTESILLKSCAKPREVAHGLELVCSAEPLLGFLAFVHAKANDDVDSCARGVSPLSRRTIVRAACTFPV